MPQGHTRIHLSFRRFNAAFGIVAASLLFAPISARAEIINIVCPDHVEHRVTYVFWVDSAKQTITRSTMIDGKLNPGDLTTSSVEITPEAYRASGGATINRMTGIVTFPPLGMGLSAQSFRCSNGSIAMPTPALR